MARRKPADWTVCPSLEPLEPRLLLSAQVVGAELDDLIPAPTQSPYVFEFSVDIGSDTELSDPNVDGDEGFDPGDVYQWQGPPVTPPLVPGGRDGFKDDAMIFGQDPWPDPPDFAIPPATRVPVGFGGPDYYYEYFDLDGHDQVDFPLEQYVSPDRPLANPILVFPSACVFSPDFLMVSFDDDMGPGWPVWDVPVIRPSPAGLVYGTTAGQDEIVGLNLAPIAPGTYTVIGTYGVADEITVHQSLMPNPDAGEDEDDDVDSLDIVIDQGVCQYWLFTADHEAHQGLDPGGIYEVRPGLPPLQVIDEAIHLGLPEDTDIDAFELAWTTDAAGSTYLTLLFSVDDDDVVTPNADESGGGDPRMIYGSYLTGFSFPLLDAPLEDDVDALTAWGESLEQEELDWGDAPDFAGAPGYPTLSGNNGANHVIAGPWLGDDTDAPDAEPDGQPDVNALGDDLDTLYPPSNDDEDGVQIPLMVQGVPVNIQLEINGGGGQVDIWIDWNGNQSWSDPGELVITGSGPDGVYTIPVTAPLGSVLGATFLRARINSAGPLPPDGPAQDGEVEDHRVYIQEPPKDWGDAPDGPVAPGYPTLSGNNGANHIIGGPWLGDANDNPDAENDGQPDPNALGDDNDGNDDEDGVQIPLLVQGVSANIQVEVNGGGGWVDVWIDWDGNQSWLQAGEQVFSNWLPDGFHPITVTAPVGSVLGPTFLRARINTTGPLPPDGAALDGEVEDHRVYIQEPDKDWGDAPDAVGALGYPTLAIHNGANHLIGGPWLGDASDNPDPENDGQPDPNALGDDNDGNDDEDGVSIPVLVQGQSALVPFEVNGAPAGGAYVDGWIDWNGDFAWDLSEKVLAAGPLSDGSYAFGVMAPIGSVIGPTFARFRISSLGGLTPEGAASDGEVEDHEVLIEEPDKDWGDAPDSPVAVGYPTLSGNNGANHVIAGPWLGDASDNPDAENDGQPDPNALGDDNDGNDDEDGVSIPVLVQGQPAGITIEVSGGGGVVEAWVDWNGDMIWQHPAEQIFTGFLPDGVHVIAVTPPVGAVVGQTFARFRISNKGGLPPTGPAPDGEVEDHEVFIQQAVTFPKWEQYPEPAQPENIYYGWNEYSVYNGQQIAADDWVCTTDAPVTDIHWWGSYIGWDHAALLPPEIPSSFYITMWTDVPADPADPASFSHPGEVVWALNCTNFISQWVGWDYDPLTGTYEACFQFNQILFPEEYFYQGDTGTEPDGENIYWISIAAVYPNQPAGVQYPWGWKTRPRDPASPAPDDAVRIFDPTRPAPGMLYGDGEPIEELGISWDLAFELTTTEGVEKWRQEPNLEDTGMDVLAGPFSVDPDGTVYYEKFLADDFRCTESGLITEIKFWSSYLDDRHLMEPGVLPSFSLALYSDVPVGPNGWSMPGELLWDAYLTPTVEMVYAWDVFEQFYDPNQGEIVGQDHVVWEYTFEIEPVKAFNQEEGNVYWLGVHHTFDLSGDGLVDFSDLSMLLQNWPAGFGWKTSLDAWNDDAVFVDVNTYGGDPHVTPVAQNWRELRYPVGHPFEGKSIDLAFAITTEPDKWLQKPDLAPTGMDVNASDNGPELIVLADDWMCTQVGEIDQIIIWGSWLHDHLPGVGPEGVTFTLSIHTDVPAEQSSTGYSMPGDVLWIREFDSGSYAVDKYAENLQEGWYDPLTGQYQPLGDTLCWIYAFDLFPGEFIQEGKPDDPEIYWLDVQAHYDDSTAYFGWKTSLDHWNDDAVYYEGREPLPGDALWRELRYPEDHPMAGESIDLAFKIIGPGEKWSQPPEQYIPDDGYNGWDEYSVYGTDQIVADDWLCTTPDPVTDVHWWGSFLGWSEPEPPNMPDAFHLGIWKDVPAGAGVPVVPFSHPGEMIWEVYCSNYTWDFVGWDFDPRDPMAPPEATFYFEQDLLEDEWFWQEPGDNIYWISISAVYPFGTPAEPWGWKTRPRDPASPAPDDAVRIFDPTDPVPGDFYTSGWPIYWPTAEESWDMAFVLTTRDLEPPAVMDVQVKGTGWSVLDYSVPVGSSAQDDPLGWSTIDQIEIVFSEDVTVTQADMTLTGTTAGVYAFSGFNYNAITYTATWTLVNRIDTDVLTIDLSDTVRDLGLNALDGEWVDEVSTYPSGNGLAGADFVFGFKVLPGDANSNNVVDGGDYTIWADNYGDPATDYTTGDFNGDGTVDGGDYTIWADHYNQTVPAAMGGLVETLSGPPAMAGAGGSGAGASSSSAAAPSAVPGRIKLATADLDVVAQPAGADQASDRSADESGLNDWRRASRSSRAASLRLELDDYVDILEAADLSVLKPAV